MLRTIIGALNTLEVNAHEMILEDLDERYFLKHIYIKNESTTGYSKDTNIDPFADESDPFEISDDDLPF